MINILVVCGAGMSTSILVKRMQEEDILGEYYIRCSDTVGAQVLMNDCDIFILAPHISYMKDEFTRKCELKHIPFMLIDSVDYTKMDGKTILDKVETKLKEYNEENLFKIVLVGGVMTDLIAMDINKKKDSVEELWLIQTCKVENFDDTKADIILLEPQFCYEEKEIRRKIKNQETIIRIPPRGLYASFDGRKLLDYIHHIYDETKKEG